MSRNSKKINILLWVAQTLLAALFLFAGTMKFIMPVAAMQQAQAGFAQLQYPSAGRGLMTLNIEFEKEYVRPIWPSAPGQQHITAHLDIPVGDLDTAVAEALDAGATLAQVQPQDDVRVLLDPAGHPFCLFLTG